MIVSWNCIGMGNKFKEEALRDMIRLKNPTIILIQETKLDESDMLDVKKQQWKTSVGVSIRARGASRGICALWDNTLLKLDFSQNTQHPFLTCLTH